MIVTVDSSDCYSGLCEISSATYPISRGFSLALVTHLGNLMGMDTVDTSCDIMLSLLSLSHDERRREGSCHHFLA